MLAPGADLEDRGRETRALRAAVASAEFAADRTRTLQTRNCPIRDRDWDEESRKLFRACCHRPETAQCVGGDDFVDIPGR